MGNLRRIASQVAGVPVGTGWETLHVHASCRNNLVQEPKRKRLVESKILSGSLFGLSSVNCSVGDEKPTLQSNGLGDSTEKSSIEVFLLSYIAYSSI